MTKEEARVELFIFARNSFEEISEKARDLGVYDDFMMIGTVGLVTGEQDGKNIVESVSTIDVDSQQEMNSLLVYLAASYEEEDEDSEGDDTSDPDFWINLN
jgi:hypothetical protein